MILQTDRSVGWGIGEERGVGETTAHIYSCGDRAGGGGAIGNCDEKKKQNGGENGGRMKGEQRVYTVRKDDAMSLSGHVKPRRVIHRSLVCKIQRCWLHTIVEHDVLFQDLGQLIGNCTMYRR
jgi:hypothetical protein